MTSNTKNNDRTAGYSLAYIGLGSNLGDRARLLSEAIRKLDGLAGVKVVAVSDYYPTAPVGGPPGQGEFLNAAVILECTMAPGELLAAMLDIESQLGRTREVHWGPRRIDLDLLLFGDQIIDQPGLKVPHPRMHERHFVIKPLSKIAPNVVHPVLGRTIADILTSLEGAAHA